MAESNKPTRRGRRRFLAPTGGAAPAPRHRRRRARARPPSPPVALVKKHPDWRVRPTDSDAAAKVEPDEKNLGTRLGCNVGPWGDYLIELCGELVEDYGLDGYSF